MVKALGAIDDGDLLVDAEGDLADQPDAEAIVLKFQPAADLAAVECVAGVEAIKVGQSARRT